MNKIMLSLTLNSMLFASLTFANSHEAHEEQEHHSESKVYIVAKGLVSAGSSIDEEESTLEGSMGKGAGFDLGYRLGHGVNIEVDYAYANVDITEKKTIEKESLTGNFHSVSLDALYSYHINEPLAVFVKGGYEYETEKIKESKSESGFLYGAGLEYELKENLGLLVEYENSTIEGVKGASFAAGLVVGLNLFE